MTNNVKENHLAYRWNSQDRLLNADIQKGDKIVFENADLNEKEWFNILKNGRRQLENLSPQVESLHGVFWIKGYAKNGLKHTASSNTILCKTLGEVQSLKDYAAKSLLLGKENGKEYSCDDDHLIGLIAFYCVWKKRNWTSLFLRRLEKENT
eukprot:Awhi_evm2s10907